MSREIDGQPDYRLLMTQKMYDAAIRAVRKALPKLTPGQQQRLAKYVAEDDPCFSYVRDEKGWPVPGDAELESQVKALEYLQRPDAETYRAPPTNAELFAALTTKTPGMSPADRVTLLRDIDRMTGDEKLERSRGLEIKLVADAPAQAKKFTHEKQPHQMTMAELDAHVREKHGADLLPSKVAEIGAMLVKRSKPAADMGAVAALKAKLATGVAYQDVPPLSRLEAEREARAVGRPLKELLGIAV